MLLVKKFGKTYHSHRPNIKYADLAGIETLSGEHVTAKGTTVFDLKLGNSTYKAEPFIDEHSLLFSFHCCFL